MPRGGAADHDGDGRPVPGRSGDVLSPASGPDLWREVMGRQTGRLAVLSTATADPSVN